MELHVSFGDIVLTPTLVTSLIITGVLMIFFMICGLVIKKADPTKPSKGFMGFIEFIYSTVLGFVSESVGEKATKYLPYVVMIAAYLALANTVGLFGLTPPTTEFSLTLSLVLVTLAYIMISGIVAKGMGGYLKDTYMGDVPKPMLILFLPLNIIGETSKIISMSFRLFGNMMSGALLLGLVSQFFEWLFHLSVGMGLILPVLNLFLNAYFDIFAGLMQTFVFCTLMMIWIQGATERET